jgi:cation diffusion facilitator CzcD-associated flavoprotein CzcO
VAEGVREGLALKTELLKSSPNKYTVMIAGEEVGEVWNWHGSWSGSISGQRFHSLKSRKQAIKQVERIYQLGWI